MHLTETQIEECRELVQNRLDESSASRQLRAQDAFSSKSDRFDKHDEQSPEEAFDGTLYKDRTRLSLPKQPRSPIIGGRAWAPNFIIGYEIKNRSIRFEIWYIPKTAKFIIIDGFGRDVRGRRSKDGYDRMNDAIDDFLYIIDKREPADGRGERERREEYTKSFVDSVQPSIHADVSLILESSVVTRDLLHNMLQGEVTQYNKSRVSRHLLKRFWHRLGLRIEMPTQYQASVLNPIDHLRRITNTSKEAAFVTGYTLSGKVDVEVWYVKGQKGQTGEGGFYVFDLSGGRVIAKNIASLRWAIYEIAKKLGTLRTRVNADATEEGR